MSRPRIALDPATPWSLRLFDRVGLPAFWTGLGIGLAVFALFLLYTAWFEAEVGRFAALSFEHGWLAELIQDLFLGFTFAVVAASVRGVRRDFEALRPFLDPAMRDAEGVPREILRYRRGALLLVGLSGGAIASLLTVSLPQIWVGGRMPGWGDPAVLWLFARNFVTWWAVTRGMLLELMLGRAFSGLGDHLAGVDLLDRAPLLPFGSRAVRNVLLWMLLTAFLSLTFAQRGWAYPPLTGVGLLYLGSFAVAAFLLPLLGAHRRIRAAKREELVRVRAALREARDRALEPGAEKDRSGGRVADLVAWEARVAAAGEWPIEASTVARFGLYLAIGLGSWLGAALVERLLGRVLG